MGPSATGRTPIGPTATVDVSERATADSRPIPTASEIPDRRRVS
jgi:hypothetical protein